MKKNILVISLVLTVANLQSQNYQISFAGSGASSTVDSVKVLNITQCTNLNIAGGDTLHLIAGVGINDIDAYKDKALYIYPNPFSEYSYIEFESPVSGNVTIGIYDITGKKNNSNTKQFTTR